MSDISALAERIGQNVIARDMLERLGEQPDVVTALTVAIDSDVQLAAVSAASPEVLARLREQD